MKNTQLFRATVNILKNAEKPLSVHEVQVRLQKQLLYPNKTTLYRMFEKMKQENRVTEVVFDRSAVRYECQQHHHHHFFCQKCDDIQCIESSELESSIHKLMNLLESKGLSIHEHDFSLKGVCYSCQKK